MIIARNKLRIGIRARKCAKIIARLRTEKATSTLEIEPGTLRSGIVKSKMFISLGLSCLRSRLCG